MTYHEAIDLGIAALDERRQRLLNRYGDQTDRNKYYAEINTAIMILTDLKERIGADGTQRMF